MKASELIVPAATARRSALPARRVPLASPETRASPVRKKL